MKNYNINFSHYLSIYLNYIKFFLQKKKKTKFMSKVLKYNETFLIKF